AIAPLRNAPSPDAMLATQALKGERATIYDRNDEGWAWGQLESDGYVGWLPEAALGNTSAKLTSSPSHARAFMCRNDISLRLVSRAMISSRSPNALSARHICGAARAF